MVCDYGDVQKPISVMVTDEESLDTTDAIVERIRTLVGTRPDLADLLMQQARQLPTRVFGGSDFSAQEFLEMYIEETQYLLALVEPYLRPGIRLLEIGGGLGLFHVIAHAKGADIVSIEPSEAGFSVFRAFGLALLSACTGEPERFVDARAEDLPWPEHRFQLVVSNNVLEHLGDLRRALQEMWRVLDPGGVLLHSCPNYLFPYEPHYKVPVIPCAVAFSGRICWRAFQRDPLWRSLNSINAFTIMRIAHSLPGARLTFHNAIGPLFERLRGGGPLSRRHGRLTSVALMRPLRAWLTKWPPQLLSPMVFQMTKAS